MKTLIYFFLNRMFGKKRYHRFFLILRNIGLQGLNYRNTNTRYNGELFLIRSVSDYYAAKEPLVLFDVGANIGNYAQLLLAQFPESATIYAFEPFSVPFARLQALQKSNSRLKTYQVGLSDKNEELLVYSSDEYSEIGGIYNRNLIFADIPHDKQEMSRFITIDSFCKENGISRIHFLKIDVEGHELAVLKGAASLLTQSRIDFIQFEFGAGNHFARTYFMDFFKLLDPGYHFYRLLSDGLEEIKSYNSSLEMQELSNFVAIKKNISREFIPQAHVS